MPTVTFTDHDGHQRTVEAAAGDSVMETAVRNGVPGIVAECGGSLSCATCHVFVEEAWLGKTGAPSEQEASMLSFAATKQDNSRLSCQIGVTPALDGLVVRMPEAQH